jgi:hypothetical protein
MKREELLEIESNLPSAYLNFMENYNDLLPDSRYISEDIFLDNVNDLKIINKRKKAELIELINYFAIGHSGCGDYYLINITKKNPQVILWNHEIGELSEDERYNSIPEFATTLIKETKEFEEDERKYEEEMRFLKKTKPWWKIF